MKLLPAERHRFVYCGSRILAGIYENSGYRHYVRYTLDGREDCSRRDNLKSRIVDEVHVTTVG